MSRSPPPSPSLSSAARTWTGCEATNESTGAGATAIGATRRIGIPSAGTSRAHRWQAGIVAAALIWRVALRPGVVPALVGSAIIGIIATLAGAPT
jgi:hypothetical protein